MKSKFLHDSTLLAHLQKHLQSKPLRSSSAILTKGSADYRQTSIIDGTGADGGKTLVMLDSQPLAAPISKSGREPVAHVMCGSTRMCQSWRYSQVRHADLPTAPTWSIPCASLPIFTFIFYLCTCTSSCIFTCVSSCMCTCSSSNIHMYASYDQVRHANLPTVRTWSIPLRKCLYTDVFFFLYSFFPQMRSFFDRLADLHESTR